MSSETSLPPPSPVSPAPGSTPPKRGLSPLAWIALVVGGVIVVGFIGMVALGVFVFRQGREIVREATGAESFGELVEDLGGDPLRTGAETMIRLNPELDLLRTDDAEGTVTFRNNRTGEEATLTYADIVAGQFGMTTGGNYSADAAAGVDGRGDRTNSGSGSAGHFGATAGLDGVPDWVPVYPSRSESQSTQQAAGNVLSGTVSSKTADSAQMVVDYYRGFLEDEGYVIGGQSMTATGDGAVAAIAGELPEEERSINVAVVQRGDGTQIVLTYRSSAP